MSAEITAKDLFLGACQKNEVDLVRSLISHGADVTWKNDDESGWSGLHVAAARNYEQLVDFLLGVTGVDVNVTSTKYLTPLMVACTNGHGNIVKKLCQAPGIELNCLSYLGRTGLHMAVHKNHPDCVEELRRAGADRIDWNVRSNDGWYPLTLALLRGHAEVLEVILTVPHPQLDLSVTDREGRTLAQMAVESNARDSLRCLEILLEDSRVNWNTRNKDRETPLMYCRRNNKTAMVKTLKRKERFERKQFIMKRRSELRARYDEDIKMLDEAEEELKEEEMEDEDEKCQEGPYVEEVKRELGIKQECGGSSPG